MAADVEDDSIINNDFVYANDRIEVGSVISDKLIDGVDSKQEILPKDVIEHNEISIIDSEGRTDILLFGSRSRRSLGWFQQLLYNLVMPFIVILSASSLAYWFQIPFIFPSLGPTAFLHFAAPDKPAASPRNTLIRHFIGIVAGVISLFATGLYYADGTIVDGIELNRIWCSALSVGLTCSAMIGCNVPHPPAGATTLIVSLGILKTPFQLLFMMTAVVFLTVHSLIINRLCRSDVVYPIWSTSVNEVQPLEDHANIGETSRTLDDLMDNLSIDTFAECFMLCEQLRRKPEMVLLLRFAKQNRETCFSQIPWSTSCALDV